MDPCTQGLLGASLSCSLAKRDKLKVAATLGAIGGMAPDLDIFIRSVNDQLLFIEYHRHFTHSLIFIPFGALIITSLLYPFIKIKNSFKSIYYYIFIGFFTHGLLDACTSYGTSLLWPFSDYRVAWNIISIIDPIFTLSLLFFIILSLTRKKIFYARIGFVISCAYLILGFYKYEKVKAYTYNIAKNREHIVQRILLNPTIGNNILWRSVYQFKDHYYVDAIYFPFFSEPIFKEGVRLKVIDKETVFPELSNESTQRKDIRRFSYFSQDFIYLHPDNENIIADLRYGTLPYDDKSLWGIEININNPMQHVKFINLRKINEKQYSEFWDMLKGNF